MILVRNRDELRRHIDNLLNMAEAEARKAPAGRVLAMAQGRCTGLRLALEAIAAWETFEEDDAIEAPHIVPLLRDS